jgi:hypothetical protein
MLIVFSKKKLESAISRLGTNEIGHVIHQSIENRERKAFRAQKRNSEFKLNMGRE